MVRPLRRPRMYFNDRTKTGLPIRKDDSMDDMTQEKLVEQIKHPAKYSQVIIPILRDLLEGYDKILDPFAGTGRIIEIRPDAYGVEIEPEWANMTPGILCANALDLPFEDDYFDAICTSPTYGNRLADHHTPGPNDKSFRLTYRHVLGRELSKDNSGKLQWGPAYRHFHVRAWGEAVRVLRPGGRFILNISDHVRNGKVMPVSAWHRSTLETLGCVHMQTLEIETPRLKRGANTDKRVPYENIMVFVCAK